MRAALVLLILALLSLASSSDPTEPSGPHDITAPIPTSQPSTCANIGDFCRTFGHLPLPSDCCPGLECLESKCVRLVLPGLLGCKNSGESCSPLLRINRCCGELVCYYDRRCCVIPFGGCVTTADCCQLSEKLRVACRSRLGARRRCVLCGSVGDRCSTSRPCCGFLKCKRGFCRATIVPF